MIKKILAILSGTVVMIVMDPLIARFFTSDLTVGISVSVLAGALIASLIADSHGWFYGLLVGIINCCITLGLFYWFSPPASFYEQGHSMSDIVARPMVLSLVFGLIGGVVGGSLKKGRAFRK